MASSTSSSDARQEIRELRICRDMSPSSRARASEGLRALSASGAILRALRAARSRQRTIARRTDLSLSLAIYHEEKEREMICGKSTKRVRAESQCEKSRKTIRRLSFGIPTESARSEAFSGQRETGPPRFGRSGARRGRERREEYGSSQTSSSSGYTQATDGSTATTDSQLSFLTTSTEAGSS